MSKSIISISSRISERGSGAGSGRLLTAEQLGALALGCSRLMDSLGSRLINQLELIKITPWGYVPVKHVSYDIWIVLVLPAEGGEMVKLEVSTTIDLYRHPQDLDLAEEFLSKVLKSIRDKLDSHAKHLDRKSALVRGHLLDIKV